jgi:hypothetical protein
MNLTHAKYATLTVLLGTLFGNTLMADVAGTIFTYQGRLTSNSTLPTGNYDFTFLLYDAPTNGNPIGIPFMITGLPVNQGLFTAAIDFGPDAFGGDARWLEIAVRTGINDFVTLRPRSALTAAPYAITALSLNAQAAATNAPWIASTNWVAAQGFQLTNGIIRKALTTPIASNATNYVVDFLAEVVQLTATNNINLLRSTNRTSAGWYGECVWYIQGGTTNQWLSWNTNWTGVGTLAASMPCLLASNKLALVAISVRGDSETNVTYAISRQE